MKNNYTKIVSPEGVSQYAWLTQPDTKFDDSGHYKVNLIIPTDKASSLIKQIDEEMIKSMATAKDSNKGKTIKSANVPYGVPESTFGPFKAYRNPCALRVL